MMAGLVLAGGRSSRFGAEKAVAAFGSGVLMDVPLAALRSACGVVAISARPGSSAEASAEALGLACLHDDPFDAQGPLAGIRRGLEWAMGRGATWLAVAPCDAITLTTEHYVCLRSNLLDGVPAAVARSVSGLEPLVAIWPVAQGLATVSEALSGGRHPSIRAVLAVLGAAETWLINYDGTNINSRADLADFADARRSP